MLVKGHLILTVCILLVILAEPIGEQIRDPVHVFTGLPPGDRSASAAGIIGINKLETGIGSARQQCCLAGTGMSADYGAAHIQLVAEGLGVVHHPMCRPGPHCKLTRVGIATLAVRVQNPCEAVGKIVVVGGDIFVVKKQHSIARVDQLLSGLITGDHIRPECNMHKERHLFRGFGQGDPEGEFKGLAVDCAFGRHLMYLCFSGAEIGNDILFHGKLQICGSIGDLAVDLCFQNGEHFLPGLQSRKLPPQLQQWLQLLPLHSRFCGVGRICWYSCLRSARSVRPLDTSTQSKQHNAGQKEYNASFHFLPPYVVLSL